MASSLAVGGIKMLGGAVATVGRALLLNPIGLAISAIAGGAYLIYQNWDGISSWFSEKWESVKSVFSSTWSGLKSILSFNPINTIAPLWENLKSYFNNFNLFDAGKKIISSVVDGLSATWGKLTKKVGDITKSIRDFFPFSPAKAGALRDIHKIKLMETVAQGINEKPLLKAVNSTTTKLTYSPCLKAGDSKLKQH